jgi:hypothetical protein
MDLAKAFATDTAAEIEGRWFPFSDARLKIARTGNARYREVLRTKYNLHRDELDKGIIDLAKSDEMLADILSQSILLDWENIADGGKPIPYTKAEAVRLLLKYRDLREVVIAKADNLENFKIAQDKEDLGNSEGASSGTSGTEKTSISSKV